MCEGQHLLLRAIPIPAKTDLRLVKMIILVISCRSEPTAMIVLAETLVQYNTWVVAFFLEKNPPTTLYIRLSVVDSESSFA